MTPDVVFQRRDINELAVVSTPSLDANQNQILLSETVPNPRTHHAMIGISKSAELWKWLRLQFHQSSEP